MQNIVARSKQTTKLGTIKCRLKVNKKGNKKANPLSIMGKPKYKSEIKKGTTKTEEFSKEHLNANDMQKAKIKRNKRL